MLGLRHLLIATTLLCAANGCGDEAEKSSGLSMSVTSDTSPDFRRVVDENKPGRINSFNGSDQQMIAESKTEDLQTNVNNCSEALVANEYLSRSKRSNNSKHEISIVNVNTTDILDVIPVRNLDLFLKVLPKNYSKFSNNMQYFNSTSQQNESRPRKYLQDLELVKQYGSNIAYSLKARTVMNTREKSATSMTRISNQNFSNNSVHGTVSSRLLALHSNVKVQPVLISDKKHYKNYLKNLELNSNSSRSSQLASPGTYSRNNHVTKLSKNYKECSKHDSKTRTKRHRERYGSLFSLLRQSSSDRLGIFVADNTGFDPKSISDRSQSRMEKSNTNSVLKRVQQSRVNGNSENSSKAVKAERLEGQIFTSIESMQFPKQPVMLSLSPDSNESYASYPLEPDLPSPDIVPLEDLRTDVEEAPRNRSLPGDPKRPYFPIEKAPVINESTAESNRLSDEDEPFLRCINCTSTTDHNYCYDLEHTNQTENFNEDLSQTCKYYQTYCLTSHIWYVDKTEESKSYHHFRIERRCASDCEPYYIVMGDKTKMEIISSLTCCRTDTCNRHNAAAEGTPLKAQLTYKVSFALLIFFKLI